MIYKGDNIVIPYKVNGTTHINNANDVTIYDMPWYEEKIVYKGSELIWPGFSFSTTNSLSCLIAGCEGLISIVFFPYKYWAVALSCVAKAWAF